MRPVRTLLFLLAVLGQFALVRIATAQAELSLSDGVGSVLVVDNGPGDTNMSVGAITFTGSVGNFTGTFGVGETKPLIGGGALQPQLALTLTTTNGPLGGTLTMLFGDTSFGPITNGTATAHIAGTQAVGGQISYDTFANGTNVILGLDTPITTQNSLSGATFDSNATHSIAFGANTSLTQRVVITQGAGIVTAFNATLGIVSGVAVPDNSSAVVLLAAAVIGLEFLRQILRPRLN